MWRGGCWGRNPPRLFDKALNWHGKLKLQWKFTPWVGESQSQILNASNTSVKLPNGRELPWVNTFGEIPKNECAVLVGSSGLIEIVANRQNAAEMLELSGGECIVLESSTWSFSSEISITIFYKWSPESSLITCHSEPRRRRRACGKGWHLHLRCKCRWESLSEGQETLRFAQSDRFFRYFPINTKCVAVCALK